ncbi:hypothetical protein [Cutibacterium modestum]|uniref:hypothetical protein n=1 Tax=Cutibacterium modestum TaxID=2559073 RepID=UPI000F05C146|nr:hypothetical protein [Cutibacterium modestum]MCP2378990.1 hypothetical protein [Cutibacterium modestum 31N]
MRTPGIMKYPSIILGAYSAAISLLGLITLPLLPPSHAPLSESVGIPVASWLVTLVLGILARPFPTKLTGKIDANTMKNFICKKMYLAFYLMGWSSIILFVLAFLLHLSSAFTALGMIADGATIFLLLYPTEQRCERFAESWCGDRYNPTDPEIDKFLHARHLLTPGYDGQPSAPAEL